MKRRELKLPTIIGLLIALGGLISGVWLVGEQARRTALAAAEESPKKVVVSNISDTGFTVSWITDQAVSGFIQYAEGSSALDLVLPDERDQQKGTVDKYFTHLVNIRGLKPVTKIKFKIGSGGNIYGNGDNTYEVDTGPQLTNTPTADVAYGQVVTGNGDPAEGALVYLRLPGAVVQSSLVKSSGSWVIPLSTTRKEDLGSFIKYDAAKEKLVLEVEDGQLGQARAIVQTGNDSPVPNIVMGTTNDFSTPDTTVVSKFAPPMGDLMGEEPANKLSIIAPKADEKVNDKKPEIIGSAPAGAKVTIEIHSDTTITGTAVADKSGNFSFSVPQDLPPGEHTIIISAMIDGAIQRVTKSFIVYAAGESTVPSYSSTPSATLVPTKKPTPTATPKPTAVPTATPIPTATPKPTAVPTQKAAVVSPTATVKPSSSPAPTIIPTATTKPSPTIKPTATPIPTKTVIISATGSAVPVSGNDTGTWMILVLGAGLIITGGWWYRKAL
jgi:hypothetical protein